MKSGEILGWESLGVEPCTDVIVSAAARRPISVGGGGGAALAEKTFFSKIPEKNYFLSSNFSDDLFSHRKLQQNNNGIGGAPTNYRRRRGDGAPINKSGRHRRQIVGGAARSAHGFSWESWGLHEILFYLMMYRNETRPLSTFDDF